MKAETRDLNIRPRPTPASSGSLMNADFDLASLVLAEWQFQDLREYMSLAQEFVVRKQQDFHKRVDDHIAVNALEGENRDGYYSSHEDDYDQVYSRFPRIIFSSTLLMACSLFESSIVDLCKSFERALPTPKPWSDVKGNRSHQKQDIPGRLLSIDEQATSRTHVANDQPACTWPRRLALACESVLSSRQTF